MLRPVVLNLALFLLALMLSIAPGRAATRITDVVMDTNNIHKWDMSNGDTWDPFWADDDNLYAFNCDGRGFAPRGGKNMAFNKLEGPTADSLVGSAVNSMDDYGGSGQKEADGATWKVDGQECIDGVFYAFVSRNTYGSDSKDPLLRQTAVNSSLIKSTDRGKTWTRSAAENYRNPMWPGGAFGTPYFVHYGKNGGSVREDEADRYVYAASNNGFWNDGDWYVLGRVLRAKLSALNPADWTYFTGGDGKNPASWSGEIGKAASLLNLPAQCGSGPACYVPALGVYLMVAWYNPNKLKSWFNPDEMRYDFYQAPHPWGPWVFIRSYSDQFITGGHWYGPSLCAKFQERAGRDVKLSMFTSGEPFDDAPGGLYKMWEIPLILKTTPGPASTLVNDDDPAIHYTGTWTHSTQRPFSDYKEDAHFTTTPGDSLEYSFTGTGIEYIAEKNADHGSVDVYLDGVFKQNVDLHLVNFPRISQVVVFSAQGLKRGRHILRVVNKSTDYGIVDAFRLYGGAGN